MRIAASASLSLVSKYILVRDAIFSVVDFFTGDRASDLGRLSCKQVFRLRDREGVLIRLSLTKTVRKGSPREFVLAPFRNPDVCPVFGWIFMFVPAKRWGSPCLRDVFSELPTMGSVSGRGRFLVQQLIIVCLCISPR